MARKKSLGQKPIKNYEVYHGWDTDLEKWFIEIEIIEYGKGSIVKWFDTKEEYETGLKTFLWSIYA